LEELGVEGEIILKLILQEIGCRGVVRIDMAQDMEKIRASVNTVEKLWVPYNMGSS
jgi:hypothetical protein